ncbi:hypothetical protein B1748_28660 [Paenibacillus sp. MY03]|jgi:hypothetical protein|uniref:Multi-TM2 domain-containing protein n=1 Tax=Paenibacillus agaridevorans TaxID=171404 RepID=A0A2R5EXC5_9BACL|nr:hypothetical protein B1748_28660 [Paenibacillus sp. MY03]GBG11362.1 hypothetical protein PAT3040_06167 [Paenibacillus agaridevorans]
MVRKSKAAAFFLSFIPGAGHAYLGRPFRCLIYAGLFFGLIGLGILIQIANGGYESDAFMMMIILAFAAAFINMLDMIFTLISGKAPGLQGNPPVYGDGGYAYGPQANGGEGYGGAYGGHGGRLDYAQEQEKSKTIMLSVIPGLGHMFLGLTQRGITFLISFIGLFAIIVFISAVMGSGAILVFLLALPVIWIYSMFDAVQLLQAKHRGEQLQDKSLFEGFEAHIGSGHKNKVLTIALSIFPGAGHLYLGLQKRGLQYMGGFLLAIYVMDNLRLSLFLFLLPLYWCFAFFDALQQIGRYERGELSDEPLLPMFVPYQRWFGIALLGFGAYFLVDRIVMRALNERFPVIVREYLMYKYMFPTAIIAFVMIVLGLRLAFGSKSVLGAVMPPERDFAGRDKEGGDGR